MEINSQLMLKRMVMPSDLNPDGDIFSGWVLSQMDLAGIQACKEHYLGRYVTIAIDDTCFKHPLLVGDVISIYTEIIEVGTTSIKVLIHCYKKVKNNNINLNNVDTDAILITNGVFKYVHVDSNRFPLKIPVKVQRYSSF